MKRTRLSLVLSVIALAVAFAPVASIAADAGVYYPTVSPDLSAKVTMGGGPVNGPAMVQYPKASPDISAKVDAAGEKSSESAKLTFFPPVSPRL